MVILGENYYYRWKHCPKCKRYEEQHIGKMSLGWRFFVESSDKCPFNNWTSFREFLLSHKKSIYDSLGRQVNVNRLLEDIKESRDQKCHSDGPGNRRVVCSNMIDIAYYEFS